MSGEITDRPAPLAGVKVLDLARVLAGPLCTQRLADLGASVIKVERPGAGDETRSWGPPFQDGVASYFLALNRGKRSLAVDFSTREGHQIIMDLAAEADVIIHNFRPHTAREHGLTRADLAAHNPGVVVCGITGFGSDRNPSDRPGYDLIVQAESGLMSVTGEVDGGPVKVGVAIVDVLTGLEAINGVLAALHQREATGIGSEIEVSLLDSALAGLVNIVQGVVATGSEAGRYANAHPSIVPYESFETSDGHIVVAAANDGLWVKFCAAVDRPDWEADERFKTNTKRVENRKELVAAIKEHLALKTSAQWLSALSEAGVPAGQVHGVKGALEAAAAAGRPATVNVGPAGSETELIAAPQRINGHGAIASIAPPALGQHTDEILAELGRSPEQITQLRNAGVLG